MRMRIRLKTKVLVLLTIVAVSSLRLDAQPYYFSHYQVESGLSNNSVECSIQDNDGFLWFGTVNGLNRFDGDTFKVFNNNPIDSNNIGSNFVRCLYNDNHGVIWIGTDKGVYTFNKIGEKFDAIKPLPKGNCTQIISDSSGRFWAIINQLIYSLDTRTNKIRLYPLDGKIPVATSIALTPDKGLWISTSNGNIKKFDPAADSFYTYSTYKKIGSALS